MPISRVVFQCLRLLLVSLVLAGTARAADVECPDPAPAPPQSGICSVTPGDAGRLVRGTVLLPDGIAANGSVLVDANGTISCAGCGCQAAEGADTATRIDCANGVISPGLIDIRDFLGFDQNVPIADSGERYERRNQWRKGLDGHTTLSISGSATASQEAWAEWRGVMAGVTSISGSTGAAAANVARNLSTSTRLDGLGGSVLKFDNFPLNDSGTDSPRTADCSYNTLGSPPVSGRYLFDAAEGISAEARNEFLCLAGLQTGSADVLTGATVMEAIPLRASDAKAIADHSASATWTPRSDLRLYGLTSPVTLFDTEGVPLALGSTWTPTGSLQLQRELTCADSYNSTYLDHHFDDAALWRMVTANAADAAGFGAEIGRLQAGRKADIAVFDASAHQRYRAVIEAGPADVVLVLKGGVPMFGESAVVEALGDGVTACSTFGADGVCGADRQICTLRESGVTLQTLQTQVGAGAYPLFFCGAPVDEPVCKPMRDAGNENNVAPFFTGDPAPGDADGDGVPDASDVCPNVFDPPRPSDGLVQADGDNDGVGDACDPCPLDAGNACDTLFKDGFDASG